LIPLSALVNTPNVANGMEKDNPLQLCCISMLGPTLFHSENTTQLHAHKHHNVLPVWPFKALTMRGLWAMDAAARMDIILLVGARRVKTDV
jgi:hypothetical protein